jgi:hypothetical protein
MKSKFLLDLAENIGSKISRRNALKYMRGCTIGLFRSEVSTVKAIQLVVMVPNVT